MPLNRIRSAPQSVDRTPPPSRHERASPVCIGIGITTYNFVIVNSTILAQCLNVIYCPMVLHNVQYYKNNKWYDSILFDTHFVKLKVFVITKCKSYLFYHTPQLFAYGIKSWWIVLNIDSYLLLIWPLYFDWLTLVNNIYLPTQIF